MDNSTPEPLPTDSTEQKIFEAAHAVFTEKGMDGAKMQEIANRAGINKAMLHYYYRTKEQLYHRVARAVVKRAVPIIGQMLEGKEPLEEKITRFIDIYVDLIARNPFIPLFVISEVNKHPDRFFEHVFPSDMPSPSLFFEQVNAEIDAGRIREVNPKHLIVNIVSMCVFPFVGKPMIRLILGMNAAETKQFLAERKVAVTHFVLSALRP